MAYTYFIVDNTDSVLHVTINRPEKRNALSRATLEELQKIFIDFKDNPSIKVAILTGAGDKSFAAGGDLKEFDSIRSETETRAMSDAGFKALRAIKTFPVPVIGAINGSALGGGAELALACDFRITSATAKIGFIQSRLGITSSWGGAIYLMERIGNSQALELLSTAKILDAEDAKQLSVVDEIQNTDETLEQCIQRFIEPILKVPSQCLRGSKALTIAANQQRFDQLRSIEHEHFTQCWLHDDHWDLAEHALKK